MNRVVPIATVVVVAVAVLAVVSLSPSFSPHTSTICTTSQTTLVTKEQTFSEGEVFITTGVLWVPPAGGMSGFYQLETSVRSVTQSQVVSIQATVNVTGASPVVVTTFRQGLAPVSSTVPLGYNNTANAEGTDLPLPAQCNYQIGQSFPETLSLTFRNGTSVEYHVSAQVYVFNP